VIDFHGRFLWYDLVTTDTGAAQAFYTKVMGWSALDASVTGSRDILFTAGKVVVSGLMELPEDARTAGGKPSWLGYVGVNDVDAVAQQITRLGGVVDVPPTDIPNVSRFATFADPQTARLAVLKWANPGQEQPTGHDGLGRVNWHELLTADCDKALAFYGDVFGWQRADADVGDIGTYHRFSAGGQLIGGILAKPQEIPDPFWLFYFNIGDLDAGMRRVKLAGGQILDEPFQVSDDSWLVLCTDPQGAPFALDGKRSRQPIGYFERVAPRNLSDPRSRRWSW
jgi:predicted enzyme related to lactoylglutathione lyase